MRPNRLREIWAAGGAAVNGWLAIPSAFSAETMAHQGWDSLTVDLQHGAVDYQAAVTMFTAISTTPTVPMATAMGTLINTNANSAAIMISSVMNGAP